MLKMSSFLLLFLTVSNPSLLAQVTEINSAGDLLRVCEAAGSFERSLPEFLASDNPSGAMINKYGEVVACITFLRTIFLVSTHLEASERVSEKVGGKTARILAYILFDPFRVCRNESLEPWISNSEISKVVVDYIKKHPGSKGKDAYLVAIEALKQFFPCAKPDIETE